MKTEDKDLLVNPLADVKPPREGPTFVEKKTTALKSVWSAIKEGISEWSFGSGGHAPPGPPRRRPPAPQRPKAEKATCPLCGTTDCLDRTEMQRLRRKSGSLGNTLLRSCEVRRQLKEMEKFRVRTSSGDEVWMTKQGRIQRPKPPPPPPPRKVDNELAELKAENEALKVLVKDEITKQKLKEAKEVEMRSYHDKKKQELLKKVRGRTRPPVR